MKVSTEPKEMLVTYSLGSCVGLALYDPLREVGGMCHTMLPLAKMDPNKAGRRPCMFTDTGILKLLESLYSQGADRRRLSAKLAGGGEPLDTVRSSRIGSRNHTIARKILWKNGILISGEDIGGRAPKTLFLDMMTGKVSVKSQNRYRDL